MIVQAITIKLNYCCCYFPQDIFTNVTPASDRAFAYFHGHSLTNPLHP